MKFKTCVLILLSFLIVYSQPKITDDMKKSWEDTVEPFKEECSKESNLDIETADNVFPDLIFPDTPNFKCYVKCVQEHLFTLNQDEEINEKNFMKQFTGLSEKIVKECYNNASHYKDVCDKIYYFVVCVVKGMADAND